MHDKDEQLHKVTALLAEQLGIESLTGEEQVDIISKLGEVALKNATITLLEKLPEDTHAEFDALSKTSDPVTMQAFLKKYITDYDFVVKSETEKVIEDFKRIKSGLS